MRVGTGYHTDITKKFLNFYLEDPEFPIFEILFQWMIYGITNLNVCTFDF